MKLDNSGTQPPYISVYTLFRGDGTDAASWYNSRLCLFPTGAGLTGTDLTWDSSTWDLNYFANNFGSAT